MIINTLELAKLKSASAVTYMKYLILKDLRDWHFGDSQYRCADIFYYLPKLRMGINLKRKA